MGDLRLHGRTVQQTCWNNGRQRRQHLVAEQGNHRVEKFAPNGTFVAKWGIAGLGRRTVLLSPGDGGRQRGTIYVADACNQRVQKFTSNGTFVTTWGTYRQREGQFDCPKGIAVDSADNVYVTDTTATASRSSDRTASSSRNGAVKGQGTVSSNGPTGSLWTARITSTSSTIPTTGSRSSRRTGRSSRNGAGATGRHRGRPVYHPCEITVDSKGNVYVVDTEHHRIQKFTSTGTFVTKWARTV